MLVQITSFYEICVHYNDDTKRLAGATEETPEYYRYLDEWYRFLIKLINMNENIDLTKILKDCPVGWKFYSSVYGDVEFLEVLHDYPIRPFEREDRWCFPDVQNRKYPIRLMVDSVDYYVSREGRHRYSVGECTLFPSRDQRDWSKFTAPWYKKEKFDPKTLKPFDKVLVKCTSIYNSNLVWRVGLFSYFHVEDDSIRVYTLGSDDNTPNLYVIPYNDNTKHLVNTTEEAPEYYRYWED